MNRETVEAFIGLKAEALRNAAERLEFALKAANSGSPDGLAFWLDSHRWWLAEGQKLDLTDASIEKMLVELAKEATK